MARTKFIMQHAEPIRVSVFMNYYSFLFLYRPFYLLPFPPSTIYKIQVSVLCWPCPLNIYDQSHHSSQTQCKKSLPGWLFKNNLWKFPHPGDKKVHNEKFICCTQKNKNKNFPIFFSVLATRCRWVNSSFLGIRDIYKYGNHERSRLSSLKQLTKPGGLISLYSSRTDLPDLFTTSSRRKSSFDSVVLFSEKLP